MMMSIKVSQYVESKGEPGWVEFHIPFTAAITNRICVVSVAHVKCV